MTNQRNQFRIPVVRRGVVTHGTQTIPCTVQDLTEHGLRFSADLRLAVGETVSLECQLDRDCTISCQLLVTYATPPHFGGRITHLLPEHQQKLAQFVERMIRASMAGF